ncbi:MAG: VWA domain-containing protein [Deltaproteobacteria bacterium]|nr:MAG: VWA domain-containing protein [Deltaproteobacteria bacterium]
MVDDAGTRPRPWRLAASVGVSAMAHGVLGLLVFFDVLGAGGGFGLGVGPGFGIGSGGAAGLGQARRREIFSLEDVPEPVPPTDPAAEKALKELLAPARPEAVAVVHEAPAHPTTPVVHFARPARPLGSGVDLGSRFASKVGVDVAIVVDATGSMQSIIDDLKRRMDDLAATLQRLVPTARVGAVAYRDRDEGKGPTGPRESEDFVVKWTDLTFNVKKVQAFFNGLVAEGGGDWPEAVRAGLETAMRQMKWRADAKRVIIIVGGSPPHAEDVPAIRKLVSEWHAKGGVISTIDVSLRLHEEHERMMHRWLYGEELKQVSPLPEFYKELTDSFGEIAHQGGGELLTLGQDTALVRHLLVLAFGPQWEKDVARIARGM